MEQVLISRGLCHSVASGDSVLPILKGIDLEIKAAERVAIVGPSGSGKTTLLSLLAGLEAIDGGEVWLCGERLNDLNEDQRAALRARHVGFVFQSFHLLDHLSALENVALPLELAGQRQAKARARAALEEVGLAARAGHLPNQLSGGERQRVALARAFVCQPQLLFADEPTGSLDSATGERIIELMFRLNREHGTTLILVTHDEQLAQRCDRQLHLEQGLMTDRGTISCG